MKLVAEIIQRVGDVTEFEHGEFKRVALKDIVVLVLRDAPNVYRSELTTADVPTTLETLQGLKEDIDYAIALVEGLRDRNVPV